MFVSNPTKAFLRERSRLVVEDLPLLVVRARLCCCISQLPSLLQITLFEGQATVIEGIDGDRWSVFEAYEELRQFEYLKSPITALWYKDSNADDFESNLKLLKGDSDAIEMCNIVEFRGFVDLFVVHEVGDADGFPEVGYIDVGGDAGGVESEEYNGGGLEIVVFGGGQEKTDAIGDAIETECQNKGVGVERGQEGQIGGGDHETNGEDSDDPTSLTGKRVVTSDLEDEEATDSDDLENDYMIGGHDLGADDAEENADYEGLSQEFKDMMAAYAVQTASNIKFKKCDLVRVQAVCQKDCPFWLYAHKVGEESTWQLRSMNLQHTCMQTHKVRIMHSQWLGNQIKKKVKSNPRIKIKDLVVKVYKTWNMIVTKAMAAKTKQETLSQIQGAFKE
ncbi:hypothetical protein Ahy_A02g005294 [Arachis hypogaea]|uniref:PB1-like domain-containing protein n=1 Tax=Arachis hypogaea TaxID=3818 RepID=A0A445E6C9_ARAHY|nr:hypothetical protein Ahy_A02g005294 [Arachis hypogaea]